MGIRDPGNMGRVHPSLFLCVVLLLGSMIGADALQTFQEDTKDCTEAVERATSECEAEKRTGVQEKDVCGTVTYTTTMTKVTHLKQMATHQSVTIQSATKALEEAKAAAASMATASGKERTHMLSLLSQQKTSKSTLHELKIAAHKVSREMRDLKIKADRATEAAVEVARNTGDQAQVDAAKKAAHDLYQQYVDYEVKMASAQRKVHEAKSALTKVTTMVESEIRTAKSTANSEARALKKVASRKMDVATERKKQAELEMEANQKAEQAAVEAEHTLKLREEQAKRDISKTKKELRDAEDAEKKAEANEQKVATEKAKDTALDFKALEKKAADIAQREERSRHHGVSIRHDTSDDHSDVHITIDKTAFKKSSHEKAKKEREKRKKETRRKNRTIKVHTHGASQDVHEKYADDVEAIEKERVESADNKAEAEQKLRELELEGANSEKIEAARKDFKTASETEKRLVDQQNAAVARVVNHIQTEESDEDASP